MSLKSASPLKSASKENFINEDNQKLYYKMMDQINNQEYAQLWDTLLYESGQHIVNDICDKNQVNLLHWAALNNDSIAFDILLNFSAKVDNQWLTRLVGKLCKPLSPNIDDRIVGIISREYETPLKQDIFEKVKKSDKSHPTTLTFIDLNINLKPGLKDASNLSKALKALFKMPQFLDLVKGSIFHPIAVKFVPKSRLYSKGECNYTTKSLNISEAASMLDQFTTVIFELCNAANKELSEVNYEHYADAEAFALASEQKEHLTNLRFSKVLRSIVANKQVMAILENCGIKEEDLEHEANGYDVDFATYWRINNEVSSDKAYSDKGYSHAEYYRRGYRQWKKYQTILGDNALPKQIQVTPAIEQKATTASLVNPTSQFNRFTRMQKAGIGAALASGVMFVFSSSFIFQVASFTLLALSTLSVVWLSKKSSHSKTLLAQAPSKQTLDKDMVKSKSLTNQFENSISMQKKAKQEVPVTAQKKAGLSA